MSCILYFGLSGLRDLLVGFSAMGMNYVVEDVPFFLENYFLAVPSMMIALEVDLFNGYCLLYSVLFSLLPLFNSC